MRRNPALLGPLENGGIGNIAQNDCHLSRKGASSNGFHDCFAIGTLARTQHAEAYAFVRHAACVLVDDPGKDKCGLTTTNGDGPKDRIHNESPTGNRTDVVARPERRA